MHPPRQELSPTRTPSHKRITAHNEDIQRRELLALALIDRITTGTALEASTAAIGELLALEIVHNNSEGIVTFLNMFRELRGRLGSEFSASWAIDILRSRMLSEVNDDRMASWYVANALFARYDWLPVQQKNDTAADELIEQIVQITRTARVSVSGRSIEMSRCLTRYSGSRLRPLQPSSRRTSIEMRSRPRCRRRRS